MASQSLSKLISLQDRVKIQPKLKGAQVTLTTQSL
jgi:hypothetical protein